MAPRDLRRLPLPHAALGRQPLRRPTQVRGFFFRSAPAPLFFYRACALRLAFFLPPPPSLTAHTRLPRSLRFGGIYADLDLRPVAPIDDLLRGQTLLLPHTPNIGLTNAMMASVAGHPFLDFALHELPRYASAWYHVSKHNTVLSSTGSTFVWALHMRWAREHTVDESARLMPSEQPRSPPPCEL